jgi:hypothetical protein
MVLWGRIATASILAVVLNINTTARTAPAEPESAGPPPAHYLLFSSTDVWRQGGFSHGGILWAPSGLDRDGPVLKLMFGGGVYRYVSGGLGNIDVQGRELSAEILPGWRFVRGKLIVTAFLGADFQRHKLLPDDPSAGLRGSYAGARAGFELWYEPTATTMLVADASASTIGPSYSARLAAGWRMLDRFYFGPEVEGFSADGNYRQLRAGLHITGLRIKSFEWSMGFGWATDSDHHDGAYGKLGVFTRR